MAIVKFPGRGLMLPGWAINAGSTPTFGSLGPIDATGEKIAVCGRFWHPAFASKDIQRILLRWGTVTKAGGSALTLSLQDVSTANGPPIQPDETQDQTVGVPNADTDFASGQWYRSASLSANRSVTHGDLLAVVCEYDGTGRLGADTVSISVPSIGNVHAGWNQVGYHTGYSVLKTAGWAIQNAFLPIIFECSDGSFGGFEGTFALNNIGSLALQNDTTPDEMAAKVIPDHEIEIDALYATVFIGNVGATFDLVLYDSGGSVLATVSPDPHHFRDLASVNTVLGMITPRTLTKGATYYVSVKPTQGTQNVTVYYGEVAVAGHLAVQHRPITSTYVQRTDAGAWSETATRVPFIGVRASGIHDGASAGGGLLLGANKRGGMQ